MTKFRRYTQEQLDSAIAEVVSGKMSGCSAARKYGIPQKTLSRHVIKARRNTSYADTGVTSFSDTNIDPYGPCPKTDGHQTSVDFNTFANSLIRDISGTSETTDFTSNSRTSFLRPNRLTETETSSQAIGNNASDAGANLQETKHWRAFCTSITETCLRTTDGAAASLQSSNTLTQKELNCQTMNSNVNASISSISMVKSVSQKMAEAVKSKDTDVVVLDVDEEKNGQ